MTKLDSIVKLTADQEAKSKVWSDFHLIESEAYHHYVIPRPNLDYPLRITVKADGESTAEKVALHLYASASYEPVKRLPNSIYSSWESETTPMSPKTAQLTIRKSTSSFLYDIIFNEAQNIYISVLARGKANVRISVEQETCVQGAESVCGYGRCGASGDCECPRQ